VLAWATSDAKIHLFCSCKALLLIAFVFILILSEDEENIAMDLGLTVHWKKQ
jgi:hypothetical protein